MPNALVSDAKAFVRDGILVARLPEVSEFWHNGANTPVPGIRLVLRNAVMVAPIVREPGSHEWVTGPALLVFSTTPEDLVRAFREIGVCENTCATLDQLRSFVNAQRDVLPGFESDPEASCAELSGAIGFVARQATADATDILNVADPVECPTPRHRLAPRHGCTCNSDGSCSTPEGGTGTDAGNGPDGGRRADGGNPTDGG